MTPFPRQIAFWIAWIVMLASALALPSRLSAKPQALSTPLSSATVEGAETACEGGVIQDDGTAESGYGFIPSDTEGEFVQRFRSGMFPTRNLESVCVCWVRTLADDTIDFEVVFYEEVDGVPAAFPFAAVPATAVVEPQGVVGDFTEVDVSGVRLPVGPVHIGARWDPSADRFFFVCTDRTLATPPVEVFFRDNLSEGEWTSVFESNDPIFLEHRAIMVRARASTEVPIEVPALGLVGLLGLVLALVGAGMRRLSRRSE